MTFERIFQNRAFSCESLKELACEGLTCEGKRGAEHAEKPPDPNVRMVSEIDVMSALEYADEYGSPVGFDASTAYYG